MAKSFKKPAEVLPIAEEIPGFNRPIAHHNWLEQFKEAKFVIPLEKYLERMKELRTAMTENPTDKAAAGWWREYHWHAEKVKSLGYKGDTSVFAEHQK